MANQISLYTQIVADSTTQNKSMFLEDMNNTNTTKIPWVNSNTPKG